MDAAGYSAIPAENTRGAMELIEEHKLLIDILIINPLIADALPFISRLKRTRSELKTVACIAGGTADQFPLPDFDAVIYKPDSLSKLAVTQWLSIIQSLSPNSESRAKAAQLLGR